MINLTSLLHTFSIYANRYGGPRYRTEELAKFLNKHLYNVQEQQLRMGEKVNASLVNSAFLSSRHTPLYLSSIQMTNSRVWIVEDELGFEAMFSEGTKILIEKDGKIQFEKIENLKPGNKRIINFEKVDALKNDKLNHDNKRGSFTENFIRIENIDEYSGQIMLCDALTSMMLLKQKGTSLERIDKFNNENIQEVYFIDLVRVDCVDVLYQSYNLEFSPFSYVLKKNTKLSDDSKNRYYEYRKKTAGKRFLEKMRSKAFEIKKDKIAIEMELKREENTD